MLKRESLRGGDVVIAARDWQIDGSILCDATVVDDDNPRPEHHRLVHVVGDEEHRLPGPPPKIAQHRLKLPPGHVVEGAKRLVGKQDRRIVGKNRCDSDPGAHAAR